MNFALIYIDSVLTSSVSLGLIHIRRISGQIQTFTLHKSILNEAKLLYTADRSALKYTLKISSSIKSNFDLNKAMFGDNC